MKTPASCIAVALALGAITLTPGLVRAQDFREEGPFEIEKCQTIDKPGSYKLVRNLTFTGTSGSCLLITTNFVTIDLAGFTISGPGVVGTNGISAMEANPPPLGLAVRNGSIQGFGVGVLLVNAVGIIVEGLRVAQSVQAGIQIETGIVRGNTVVNTSSVSKSAGGGIFAAGTVTGNFSGFSDGAGFVIAGGSTVIGNTATNNLEGMVAFCPSNITDNTVANNSADNLRLIPPTEGCNVTNNVAP
jgi:hypothetical protein